MFDKLFKDVHEGIFSCQATNQVGDADTHIELQIFGKSKSPRFTESCNFKV